MEKITLQVTGLDCAACAAKIEKAVSRHPDIKATALNFSTGSLRVEYDGKMPREIAVEIGDIVRDIEPDAAVRLPEEARSSRHGETEKFQLPRIFLSAALFAAGIIAHGTAAGFVLMLLSYFSAGAVTLWKALRNIARGRIFDENFLMAIASVGAFAIGEYPEGAAVMLFYQVGEFFQELAVNRSRKSIAGLLDIRPDFANVLRDGTAVRVAPENVRVGEIILVRPGEKIPLDGCVVSGSSSLDTSALTGESLPRDVAPDDEALSGSVNLTGVLQIKTEKNFSQSTVSKILALVEDAGSRKAPAEQFITKFARYYTPAVVGVALLIAVVPSLIWGGFSDYLHRALIFLVVSCPCALVISVPLSFFAGIGAASKNGILVKGGSYLEALPDVHTVVFDKTGTLTEGKFTVSGVHPHRISKEELLRVAAHAELHSMHPIAGSILRAYGAAPDPAGVEDYREHSGYGVSAAFEGRRILAGNRRLMEQEGIRVPVSDPAGTVVHLARDGEYLGHLVIEDRIKPDSKPAIDGLRMAGVRRQIMLTGDSEAVGASVARELGLDGYRAGLLPHQKVEKIEELLRDLPKGKKLLFVGDGINDAPSLARADIGAAMGGVGSDAAVEAADVVLMNDEPSKLADALRISRKTRRIVWQNIVFALGIKLIIMLLAAANLANMWAAVFADVGVSLIAILNALRVLGKLK